MGHDWLQRRIGLGLGSGLGLGMYDFVKNGCLWLGLGLGLGLLGGVFPYTYACKAGLSGMRFNEGGQGPSPERSSRNASSTHVTCHKTQAQFGIHHPRRMWVPLSHPVMLCAWPLNSQTQYLERYELST